MPATFFLILCLIAAIPAVIIYWPFVHKVAGAGLWRTLYLAAWCQFASFLTSWMTFLSMDLVFHPYSWNLSDTERSFWSFVFITTYQMSLVPLIAALLGLWIVKKRTFRDGAILWAGHIVFGMLFFSFLFWTGSVATHDSAPNAFR